MLYVLFGADSFSRREALRQLKAELDSDGMLDAGAVTFDARQVTPQELIAACDTLPFLSPHRLVIVEGLLQQTAEGPRGRRSRRRAVDTPGSPWQVLAGYVDRMPPTTTLVLLDGDVPADSPLLDALRDKGTVRHFRPPDRRALPDWVQRRARTTGLQIDARAARLLAELVGSDLWALAGELDKLAAYAAGRPVSEEDVRALVSAARELEVWDLLDAVVEGRPAVALKQLRRLIAQGRNPSYLLATIQGRYRRLTIAREMLDAGASAARIGERLGASGYGLERLLDQASRYPLPRLRAAFRRLLEADVAIKRGIYDEELSLELLVQDLAAAPSRAA
ncbi:MAG: DNA polymerase III subunit delta [Chloroflexi bacterium]|nr:DNA polymerase III subunit delta [Chloroflexota bacterium]